MRKPHLTWHVAQAYSAIMHFSGALASIPASYFTQHWGRKGYVTGAACIAARFAHLTLNTFSRRPAGL